MGIFTTPLLSSFPPWTVISYLHWACSFNQFCPITCMGQFRKGHVVTTYPSVILQQPLFLLLSQVISYGLCQSPAVSRPLSQFLPGFQPQLLVLLLLQLSGQHPSKGEKGNNPPPVQVSISHQLLHHLPEAGAGVWPALPQEGLGEGVEASLVLCLHVLGQAPHGSGWLAGRWRGWPGACAAQGQVVLSQSQGLFPQPARHFLPGRERTIPLNKWREPADMWGSRYWLLWGNHKYGISCWCDRSEHQTLF